jgi:hypothetical protein
MPTTTPNPAELAEQIKRLSGVLEVACCIAGIYNRAPSTLEMDRAALHAAIDQLRDLASGPSAGAVADWRVAEFWSSGTPGTKVKLLADEPVQLEHWPKRKDFIRWLSAPAATPPAENLREGSTTRVPGVGEL